MLKDSIKQQNSIFLYNIKIKYIVINLKKIEVYVESYLKYFSTEKRMTKLCYNKI